MGKNARKWSGYGWAYTDGRAQRERKLCTCRATINNFTLQMTNRTDTGSGGQGCIGVEERVICGYQVK